LLLLLVLQLLDVLLLLLRGQHAGYILLDAR